MTYTIFIFRRDFRTYDNLGLYYAMKKCDKIIPCFFFNPLQIDEKKNKYFSHHSVQFLCESLSELSKEIPLHIFHGNDIEILNELSKHIDISDIIFNMDYTPFAKKRDKKIEQWCQKQKIQCSKIEDYLLKPIGTFNKDNGAPYTIYTPFKNNVFKHIIPKPQKQTLKNLIFHKDLESLKTYQPNMDYYIHNPNNLVLGGRKHGLKQLKKSNQLNYEKNRNTLFIETSQLSSYIKYGCLSIREVYHYFKETELKSQVIWREFYFYINYYFPDLLDKSKNFQSKYDSIQWVSNKKHLELWKQGETGYPIVDACMKQLNHSGYMHNRGRLISSNFMNRILGLDWRHGELYFAQQLIDYDPCVNNGNWQWIASVGVDPKPYFQRLFNPWLQSEKFDKDALYIKKWLPQLKDIPPKHLHQWEKYYQLYDINYPNPIISYQQGRKRSVEMYRSVL
jgi:deoxyribodipyrimidine photo-lyase